MPEPMAVMIRRYSMRGSMEELLARVQQQFARQLTHDGQTADAAAPVVPSGILSYQAVQTGEQSLLTITVFETQQHLERAQAAARDIRESLPRSTCRRWRPAPGSSGSASSTKRSWVLARRSPTDSEAALGRQVARGVGRSR